MIFDRHASAVHAYCRGRLYADDAQSAADLVSVVFLEAWRRRKDVVLEQDSALPWLLGTARRVLLGRSRTVRRHRAVLTRLAGVVDPVADVLPDPADEIAHRLDDTSRLIAVREAFGRLRDDDRDVLLLCVWGGLDYAAAAVALGIPIGTVRSRLSRARTRLLAQVADADRPDARRHRGSKEQVQP